MTLTQKTVASNNDPLRQGAVLTEDGKWATPICCMKSEDRYQEFWIPEQGSKIIVLDGYYIGVVK